MNSLLFLHNELINPELQREMHLPLHFICFGIIKGKMYRHFGNHSTFVIQNQSKAWGNEVVYGGLFLCDDFDFYNRIIDAYHICSLSTLLRNHQHDIHHRQNIEVTPIYFDSLSDLASLKYREGQPIIAQTYLGNPNHPKITQRLNKTVSYRLIDGIDAINFKKLFGEVVI